MSAMPRFISLLMVHCLVRSVHAQVEEWTAEACAEFDTTEWATTVESKCCPIVDGLPAIGSGHRRAQNQAGAPCDGHPPETCAGDCALAFLPLMVRPLWLLPSLSSGSARVQLNIGWDVWTMDRVEDPI